MEHLSNPKIMLSPSIYEQIAFAGSSFGTLSFPVSHGSHKVSAPAGVTVKRHAKNTINMQV